MEARNSENAGAANGITRQIALTARITYAPKTRGLFWQDGQDGQDKTFDDYTGPNVAIQLQRFCRAGSPNPAAPKPHKAPMFLSGRTRHAPKTPGFVGRMGKMDRIKTLR